MELIEPKFKYFTLGLSDRNIFEVEEKRFSELVLSDLFIGGDVQCTGEIKENTFYFFQTIGGFDKEDMKSIKEFTENYGE